MTPKHLQLIAQRYSEPEEQNIARHNKTSGGGNGGDMNDNERIARLEVKVDNIENTLQEVKVDIRELRGEISNTRIILDNKIGALDKKIDSVALTLNNKIDATFKWFLGVLITSGSSAIASVIALALHFIK